MTTGQPDYEAVIRPLKGFQRRTVEYAFQQLYKNPTGKGRFLVADEVGLGKTLVARGVIARTIEHLWNTTGRIDIIYICSNADIARQNIDRLTIPGLNHFTPADRITLLPISVHQRDGRNFKDEKVNFVPLTPGTSFRMFSQFGLVWERALLYRMLEQSVELPMDGAMQVFSGDAGKTNFRYQYLDHFDTWYHIDPTLKDEFLQEFEKDKGLRDRLVDLCRLFHISRKEIRGKHRQDHLTLISDLRVLLAETCMNALEPDLVILDEFQRFKHLLTVDNEAGELAQKLFSYPGVRALLLSATPYKMYTLPDESEEEDHHSDFLETLKFLFDNEIVGAEFRELLQGYRQALLQFGNQEAGGRDREKLLAAKTAVEYRLRQVMARTEKLTASADRNGMFKDVPQRDTYLKSSDLAAYVGLQQVSTLLDRHNTLEYWKSAPYLLNFMEHYQFKKHFEQALDIQEKERKLARKLNHAPQLLLSLEEITQYQSVDPGNARLRQLMVDTIDSGAWQLLWLPPSLPYYQLGGPFNSNKTREFTKRLVFSAWHVVPKVVASLLSYEAERRAMLSFDETAVNTTTHHDNLRGRLQIARSGDRLTGMPVLAIMYPSPVLAEIGDSLPFFTRYPEANLPDSGTLLSEVQAEIEARLSRLPLPQSIEGPADESWYWAAPVLLDQQTDIVSTSDWWQTENLAALWGGEENTDGESSSAWAEHVISVQNLVNQANPFKELGRPPEDLSRVLAQIAIGGLGNAALRALSRLLSGKQSLVDRDLRLDAATVAWAFRALFNVPEATALVRSLYQDTGMPYWQEVLAYSIDGCLQSVLDEYSHVLHESLGLVDSDKSKLGKAVAEAMSAAVQLRTASLKIDDIQVNSDKNDIVLDSFRLRSHYAQRFGDIHSDSDKRLARKGAVREAFNSPFWPFVLVTTSVGQEGLDFHQYCHAIVHWNLPANPVDLEQREGRVHRYKGHAIRKNVAHDFGAEIMLENMNDPWQYMFARASNRELSDLVPFWIYPENGQARAFIERYVPVLPLSQDAHRLVSLRKALTVYRMVFGQNRQEDLVAYLLNRLTQDEIDELTLQLQINLQPLPT